MPELQNGRMRNFFMSVKIHEYYMKQVFALLVTLHISISSFAQAGNVNSETLMIDWPDTEGWKVASNQENKEMKIIELLRGDETFDNWTEIGTMMVYPNIPYKVPVDTCMNIMFQQAKQSCPSAKLTFIEKDDKTKYPWIIFKIECPVSSPESQVWHIILGTNQMFVNFRAVKQKAVPEDLKNKWTAFFKTSKIVYQ